jgi:hypothetical protein
MRKFTKEETAEWLDAQRRAYRKLINEVVDYAHSAENSSDLPGHVRVDIKDEAFSRLNALEKLIRERGGFQREEANLVLENTMWETKERCARWLRTELELLRESEARTGAAPVRNRQALSRIQIADLAVTMLGCLEIGDNLLGLFQELLNVDRHRRELATRDVNLDKAAQIEAQLTLQGFPCGVQKLAKLASVRPSSVTRWRRSSKYRDKVESNRHLWSYLLRDEIERVTLEHGALTDEQVFRHAFRMSTEKLFGRPAWMGKGQGPVLVV